MENKDIRTNRIRDIPIHDRPRERLKRLGPKSLSDAELLAVLLRVGFEGKSAVELGDIILREFKDIQGIQSADFQDLCNIKGIGMAKAAQIKAAIELGRRLGEKSEGFAVIMQSPKRCVQLSWL